MSGLYRGYPDLATTMAAGKELVVLTREGRLGENVRHTAAVGDTVTGGLLGMYPGEPTSLKVGAKAKPVSKPKALSAKNAAVLDELESCMEEVVDGDDDKLKAMPDIGAWVSIFATILELLRKRKQAG